MEEKSEVRGKEMQMRKRKKREEQEQRKAIQNNKNFWGILYGGPRTAYVVRERNVPLLLPSSPNPCLCVTEIVSIF